MFYFKTLQRSQVLPILKNNKELPIGTTLKAESYQTNYIALAVSFSPPLLKWKSLIVPVSSIFISFWLTLPQALLYPSPCFTIFLLKNEEKITISLSHLNIGLHRRPELVSEEFVSIHDTVYDGSIIFVLLHFYICSNKAKELVHDIYVIFTTGAKEAKLLFLRHLISSRKSYKHQNASLFSIIILLSTHSKILRKI